MKDNDDKNASPKTLTDLLFSTLEKMAVASGKLKDSAEPAIDMFKGLRDDIQARVAKEFSDRLKQIDWDRLSRKAAEDIAEKFDIEVKATISFRPKSTPKATPEGQE